MQICQHWLLSDIKARGNTELNDNDATDAFRLAARKVANLSGDARRVVQICKRALEIAEEEASDERDSAEDVSSLLAARSLTVHHINAACEEMFKSPKFAYLRDGATQVERVFVESYLDIVDNSRRDSAALEEVYKQMIVRIRVAGGGNSGGGGETRTLRSRTTSNKPQQQLIDESLVPFQAAHTAMKNLLTAGILQECAGEAVRPDVGSIVPQFFTLTMSAADARRALEMNTAVST